MVTNRTIINRQAITAKPVIKLKGLTNWSVDTGCADTKYASTFILRLSSCVLQP